jgi:hypothetical protein
LARMHGVSVGVAQRYLRQNVKPAPEPEAPPTYAEEQEAKHQPYQQQQL